MSKIKKFLDFITGYTSFNNKLNKMVNRDRQVKEINPSLSTDDILELYSLIKDYVSSVGDIPGVEIRWQETALMQSLRDNSNYVSMISFRGHHTTNNIQGLDSFMVQANLIITSDVNMDELINEINSSINQLESEDFILEWKVLDEKNFQPVKMQLVVKHKSYNQPVQKRMRRVA